MDRWQNFADKMHAILFHAFRHFATMQLGDQGHFLRETAKRIDEEIATLKREVERGQAEAGTRSGTQNNGTGNGTALPAASGPPAARNSVPGQPVRAQGGK